MEQLLSNPVEQATAMQHAHKPRPYEQLEALPEGLTGELLNGQLHTQPRPAGPHALTESNLQIEIGGPLGKGRGGPGGCSRRPPGTMPLQLRPSMR
jgi:hypothetical protein